MVKQNSGKPQIDENFMKEIISQGIPAKRDNQPDATPKEDAPELEKETRQAEAIQVTEQPQTENQSPVSGKAEQVTTGKPISKKWNCPTDSPCTSVAPRMKS